MKNIKYRILALSLSILVQPTIAGEPVKKEILLQEIANFSKTKDAYALEVKLAQVAKVGESPEVATDLLCAILVQADRFLSENPKPEKTPQLNISPPGGGLSGIGPKSIADPDDRAAYEKLLADNAKLAEEHRRFQTVASIKASALNLLAINQINGTITPKIVTGAIAQLSENKEQRLTLAREVEIAVANKAQHPTDGAAEPEKPKK